MELSTSRIPSDIVGRNHHARDQSHDSCSKHMSHQANTNSWTISVRKHQHKQWMCTTKVLLDCTGCCRVPVCCMLQCLTQQAGASDEALSSIDCCGSLRRKFRPSNRQCSHPMSDQSVTLTWHRYALFRIHLRPVVSHFNSVDRLTNQPEPS